MGGSLVFADALVLFAEVCRYNDRRMRLILKLCYLVRVAGYNVSFDGGGNKMQVVQV